MADLNAHYCTKMIHHHGFLSRADMTSQFAGISEEQVGRADLACSRGGRAVNIEIKQGKAGFLLTNWREPQREWAAWTTQPPFSTPYYMFLTLGEHPATYDPSKYLPKRSWLIPYTVLLEVDTIISPHQKTIPMRVGKGMNKEMQRLSLDAITLLKDYELQWNKTGSLLKPYWLTRASEMNENGKDAGVIDKSLHYGAFWTIPKNHVFYQTYIADNELDIEKDDYVLDLSKFAKTEKKHKDYRQRPEAKPRSYKKHRSTKRDKI